MEPGSLSPRRLPLSPISFFLQCFPFRPVCSPRIPSRSFFSTLFPKLCPLLLKVAALKAELSGSRAISSGIMLRVRHLGETHSTWKKKKKKIPALPKGCETIERGITEGTGMQKASVGLSADDALQSGFHV